MKNWKLFLGQRQGILIAIGLFVGFYGLYSVLHPRGFSASLFGQNANESFVLVMAAMAQTVPVITGGLDLSVGAVITLVNCLASRVVSGGSAEIIGGLCLCLGSGALCGFVNGCLVVYGRLQPIIATLASGTIFLGFALFLRPTPGGKVNGDSVGGHDLRHQRDLDLAGPRTAGRSRGLGGKDPDAALADGADGTGVGLFQGHPIWPGRLRDRLVPRGGVYVRSAAAEGQARRLHPGWFFSGVGGLYLALQTSSGNADIPQAGAYTLNSIAGVVIGGTSLYGGVGGAVGSMFGALVLRSVAFNFRVFNEGSALGFLSNPLYQPLFEGLILLTAVCLGAAGILRVKHKLQIFR